MQSLPLLIIDSRQTTLPDTLVAQLSASSLARFESISTPHRRSQFLLGRWLIAQAANCKLTEIVEGEHYPHFAHQPDWHASISHSGPYVAVVFSQAGRFGLDIEYPQRQRDWLALAERAFHPLETSWIAEVEGTERQARFTQIWILREAAFKAGLIHAVIGGKPVWEQGKPVAHLQAQTLRHADVNMTVVGNHRFTLNLKTVAGCLDF